MLNLDTHILLFALSGELTKKEEKVLASNPWSLSAIVLWEIAKLVELGRIELELDSPAFQKSISRLHVWPLTFEICREIPKLDFDSDPADEIIASTSIVHRVPLMTRDHVLLKSRRIPLV